MIHLLRPYDHLAMGTVTRWHTLRTARAQTVAEHTQRVTMIAVTLGRHLSVDPLLELEIRRLAEWHDMHETVFGDMPHPVKKWLLEAESLDFDAAADAAFCERRGVASPFTHASILAKRVVAVADRLEGACFYWQEGLTLWDPEVGDLKPFIVYTALKAAKGGLPEVVELVSSYLVEAGVPADMVEGFREVLA